jgi:hypothetical protein
MCRPRLKKVKKAILLNFPFKDTAFYAPYHIGHPNFTTMGVMSLTWANGTRLCVCIVCGASDGIGPPLLRVLRIRHHCG